MRLMGLIRGLGADKSGLTHLYSWRQEKSLELPWTTTSLQWKLLWQAPEMRFGAPDSTVLSDTSELRWFKSRSVEDVEASVCQRLLGILRKIDLSSDMHHIRRDMRCHCLDLIADMVRSGCWRFGSRLEPGKSPITGGGGQFTWSCNSDAESFVFNLRFLLKITLWRWMVPTLD